MVAIYGIFSYSTPVAPLLLVKWLLTHKSLQCSCSAHGKWKETMPQPSILPGPAVPGCCLVYFHILWAILSTSTVESHQGLPQGRVIQPVINLVTRPFPRWGGSWRRRPTQRSWSTTGTSGGRRPGRPRWERPSSTTPTSWTRRQSGYFSFLGICGVDLDFYGID